MTALHSFIQAAASFYGVPVDQVMEGSTLDASNGDIEVVLRVALTPEDVAGIAQRMQRMAQERKVDEAQAAKHPLLQPPTDEALREAYNQLPAPERSMHGSFARFKAYVRTGQCQPDVVEKAELPAHVWLDRSEVTEQQKAMAVGIDERGRYAVDPADLTPEQRLRHGIDGVTSNADDFGGLPG